MKANHIPTRHAACSGIHGELSNRMKDRPLRLMDAIWSAVVLGGLYLVLCIGAAHGF